jgi:hypothetical protein
MPSLPQGTSAVEVVMPVTDFLFLHIYIFTKHLLYAYSTNEFSHHGILKLCICEIWTLKETLRQTDVKGSRDEQRRKGEYSLFGHRRNELSVQEMDRDLIETK